MKASAIKPHHLLVSVQSLQSVCTKKNSGTDLIDNAALTQLARQVRTELQAYNDLHDIPELKIILNRFPEPRSYERESRIMFFTSIVARLMGFILGAMTIFYPLIFIPLLFAWLICSATAYVGLSKRRRRIQDDMRQIAECCGTAVMLIRNNESYVMA
jgi:hypothetical protein